MLNISDINLEITIGEGALQWRSKRPTWLYAICEVSEDHFCLWYPGVCLNRKAVLDFAALSLLCDGL